MMLIASGSKVIEWGERSLRGEERSGITLQKCLPSQLLEKAGNFRYEAITFLPLFLS